MTMIEDTKSGKVERKDFSKNALAETEAKLADFIAAVVVKQEGHSLHPKN